MRFPALAAFMVAATLVTPLAAQRISPAISADPPRDPQHPAGMVVLHIPTGGVQVNGVAYVAAGAGRHPTFILLHGLPGNEKNLDLAQAVRRDGWNVVTLNYRGSWGSPGVYRFAQDLEDADAVLAYLRAPSNAGSLGVDTTRLVLAGHSLGGWVTVLTAGHDRGLAGAVLISAADIGARAGRPRAEVAAAMAGNMESLAGVTPEKMADELIAHPAAWRFERAYDGLARMPLLVITADDGLAPGNDSLVAAVRARGNTRVTATHMATDHSYSDHRIALENAVIRWLDALPRR